MKNKKCFLSFMIKPKMLSIAVLFHKIYFHGFICSLYIKLKPSNEEIKNNI